MCCALVCRTLALCLLAVVFPSVSQAAPQDPQAEARALVERAVQLYEDDETEMCVAQLKRATTLDPDALDARLYLAAIYLQHVGPERGGRLAEQEVQAILARNPNHLLARLHLGLVYSFWYIPGAPSEENARLGQRAVAELEEVLRRDPGNLPAIDTLGWLWFSMAGEPFDPEKFRRANGYYLRRISIRAGDPEPHYMVGVLSWTVAFRANTMLRAEHAQSSVVGSTWDFDQPLPAALRKRFVAEYGATVEEGINHLGKATELASEWAAPHAYLNLLLRQKADMVATAAEREQLLARADSLVEKVKQLLEAGGGAPPQRPRSASSSPKLVALANLEDYAFPEYSLVPPPPPPPPPPAETEAPATAGAPSETPGIRIRIGGEVMQARLIHQSVPKYPPLARQAKIQGTVRLQALIAIDGSVAQLEVISGHPLLVQAALDAVREWRYQPMLLEGQPVEVVTTIDVVFSLSP